MKHFDNSTGFLTYERMRDMQVEAEAFRLAKQAQKYEAPQTKRGWKQLYQYFQTLKASLRRSAGTSQSLSNTRVAQS